MLALAACSNHAAADPGTDGAGLPEGWLLRLPAAYEHWRPVVATELAAAAARTDAAAARWPTAAGWSGRAASADRAASAGRPASADRAASAEQVGGPREVRVLTPREAELLYERMGWREDPRVPRTYPGLRLAVVPLPRDDRLLRGGQAADPGPRIPQTWLHDLQHETAHLACLDRPGLADAPTWFLEGLAEAQCAAPRGAAAGDWPRWEDADLWAPDSSEGLQRARARAVTALLAGPAARPWEGVEAPQPAGGAAAPARALRGRHAGWWPQAGSYLVAPPAGALASVDLPESWDGAAPLRITLQAGDSGRYPDAGLLLAPPPPPAPAAADPAADRAAAPALSAWLRLRITAEGAFGARLEQGGRLTRMMELTAAVDPAAPRAVELRLDGDALEVRSGAYAERFPVGPGALAPPFALRLYAFDTAVRLDLAR